jgi:hypothetical protein
VASIRKLLIVEAAPAQVWDALCDVGAVHTRLARDFVVATHLEGDERVVSFANGFVVRERIVTVDHGRRRLVYAAVGGRTTHHNASFEVIDWGPDHSQLVWTTDLLPDDAAPAVDGMMEHGLEAMKRTLETGSI